MWNGRFSAPSGDPFDNSQGFLFPPPEGVDAVSCRTIRSSPHLLIAQAHIPPTELVEVAGFTGTAGTIGPDFDQFDDGLGRERAAAGRQRLPQRADPAGGARAAERHSRLPRALRPRLPEVAAGAPIDFTMFGRAIAEFEFTLVFADAPIDRFARGDSHAR